jgi:hypothetical protein
MPGKKGRSGRRKGSLSWNPTARAGYSLISLRQWWQYGVLIWAGPDKHLIMPPTPEAPVPARVNHTLAQMAIEHTLQVTRKRPYVPRVEQVMAWATRHAPRLSWQIRRKDNSCKGSMYVLEPKPIDANVVGAEAGAAA